TYEETLGALCQAPESIAPILRHFEWILLQETGYGFEGEQPSLEEFRTDPSLRQALRERIDHLIGRPLRTRQVLRELFSLYESMNQGVALSVLTSVLFA